MGELFGTDGIRGEANREPMTASTALRLGQAAGYLFQNEKKRHRFVIGKDTRISGYMFENALMAGICSTGVNALMAGVLPTPGIAQITRSLRADAGVVISASHNHFADNGIKFFSAEGFKLPDEVESRLEELVLGGLPQDGFPPPQRLGRVHRLEDAWGRYVEQVKASFPRGRTLEGLRVVLDCANGAGYRVGPAVFRELDAQLTVINGAPDGTNINRDCGSEHPEGLAAAVREAGADVGVALDGDGDRVILVDEHGAVVDGDVVMAVCARRMIETNTLPGNTVVATIMSNKALELTVRRWGGKVDRVPVGDRWVAARMRERGYTLGGEQSGHLIFMDYNSTGDGLVSALQVLAIMLAEGRALSELASCYEPLPQHHLKVRVREQPPLETLPEVMRAHDEAVRALGDEGRVVVRYSGTEPVLRIMVEGPPGADLEGLVAGIAHSVKKAIGEET